MDKMQNFSDASEDEDDKVNNRATNFHGSISVFLCVYVGFPADYIFSVDVLDCLDIVEYLGLPPLIVYLQ